MKAVSKSGYIESLLGYDSVDWFVREKMKLEKEMTFYFKKIRKDIMTEENEETYRNNIMCSFCEKQIVSDKVRDHCHLTSKYSGSAHSKSNNIVTEKQIKFIPFIFHNFSKYDRHLFFERIVNEKKDQVNFEVIPERNEEYISVTYGCIRFTDSYRFLSSRLDQLVKKSVKNNHKTLKKLKEEMVDEDGILNIVTEIEEKSRNIEDLKKII